MRRQLAARDIPRVDEEPLLSRDEVESMLWAILDFREDVSKIRLRLEGDDGESEEEAP